MELVEMENPGTYARTTRGVEVTVEAFYLGDQSLPEENHFVWAYHVRIQNHGDQPVQLMTRYWQITDSIGNVHEVRGDGVVGEQPILAPGDSFEYTSGTPLTTPSGIMVGAYRMALSNGDRFDVDIPAFSLDSPHQAVQIH